MGNISAMNNLGTIYQEEDMLEEAKKWYELAAEKGEINAMKNLGALHKKLGNTEESEKWYKKFNEVKK